MAEGTKFLWITLLKKQANTLIPDLHRPKNSTKHNPALSLKYPSGLASRSRSALPGSVKFVNL